MTDDELLDAIRELDVIYLRAKETNAPADWANYRALRLVLDAVCAARTIERRTAA